MLLDLILALLSTETHNITKKNLALFRPKLRDSYCTNQITRFVNYCCYSVNVIEFVIRLNEGLKHSHGIEIRSRDSIVIPLIIAENRAILITVSIRAYVEQGLPQG